MTLTKIVAIAFAAAGLTFGQIKIPKMSDLKDKMNPKKTSAASSSSASDAGSSTTPAAASGSTAGATPAATPAAAKEEPFTPLPAGPTKGTYQNQGLELTLCEKGVKEGQWDVACAKAARTFEYKGGVANVFGTFRFTPPLTNESPRFKVQIFKNDTLNEYREITFRPGGRTAAVGFTVPPGNYVVKVVDQYDDSKIALVDKFVVAPDTIGKRAVGNVKAGSGKLMVCSEIDDNWKCVNESTTWGANKTFNLYVRLPEAISGEVCGWAIFHQNPDGTDGPMVDDVMQGTQGRAAYWATTQGFKLPAGKYTIYSILWSKRSSSGNFDDYFAKTTLTVQ